MVHKGQSVVDHEVLGAHRGFIKVEVPINYVACFQKLLRVRRLRNSCDLEASDAHALVHVNKVDDHRAADKQRLSIIGHEFFVEFYFFLNSEWGGGGSYVGPL